MMAPHFCKTLSYLNHLRLFARLPIPPPMILVVRAGIGPALTESKSAVLPLYERTILKALGTYRLTKDCYYLGQCFIREPTFPVDEDLGFGPRTYGTRNRCTANYASPHYLLSLFFTYILYHIFFEKTS